MRNNQDRLISCAAMISDGDRRATWALLRDTVMYAVGALDVSRDEVDLLAQALAASKELR